MLATLDVMTALEDASLAPLLQESFFIRNNFVLTRVRVNEVLWVHADGNYCYLITKDKKYIVKSSLKKLAVQLSLPRFARIHKGYIVQLDCIEKVDTKENTVTIGDTYLPLGRIYKEALLEILYII